MKHSDLIVEALDKAQGDLVLGEAVGCDSLPVAVDHLGEFLEGRQFLPFQGYTPVLEELPGPGNAAAVPELSEGLLEQVGRLQPLIGLQQRPRGLLAIQGEVLPMRQQRISLSLDKLAIFATQSGVLATTHLVQGLSKVAQRMKLVVQDCGVGHVRRAGIAEQAFVT